MKVNKAHCLFEQSGTFKNEFIKLGIPAEDYDIKNDFKQTDHICDLYKEISKGYKNESSIFDNIGKNDLIMAFFPCVRFESQIIMNFKGENHSQKNWNDIQKLEYDLKLHKELAANYELITKLAIIVIKRNLKMIIENPYNNNQHYLNRYWCLKPGIIDMDKTLKGDYFTKPTQYWFIGFEHENNIVFETQDFVDKYIIEKGIKNMDRTTSRSLIHPQYANRFIREFIL